MFGRKPPIGTLNLFCWWDKCLLNLIAWGTCKAAWIETENVISGVSFVIAFFSVVTLEGFLNIITILYSIINSTRGKYCSTAFIWMVLHFRISSTDSEVRTTLYSIINSTRGKYSSVDSFYWIGLSDFFQRLRSLIELLCTALQHNKSAVPMFTN